MSLAAFDVLARCPLLAGLPDDDIAALAACATRRRYAAGETLFLEGDPSHGLQVIAEGEVKVFLISPASGRELLLHYERRFGTVAELVALDGGPYPASAQAVTDTELLVVPPDSFVALLRERPNIALHLMRSLGRNLRRLVALVNQISFQEVQHRLAGYLLRKARHGVPFELKTNAQIGARIGTVSELVSRNLSRLHAEGAIRLSGRTVEAVDEAALAEMAAAAGR
ncbi:MAG TPA: Crp/Fnr family transcriptional regulator [Trueperaceae bacterium]|nr:Crp/Fnr family transcriptional regulator [Trueperaceae bacterium]